MGDDKLHRFQSDVSGIELPALFTYPMHYVPHELCKIAAREVMDYALSQEQWRDELLAGKMLGVLVVKDGNNELGYLAAYSGNLAHNGNNPYFVPHIYNLLEPQGLFRTGEAEITEINHRIEELESSSKKKELENLRHTTMMKQKSEVEAMISRSDSTLQNGQLLSIGRRINPWCEPHIGSCLRHRREFVLEQNKKLIIRGIN